MMCKGILMNKTEQILLPLDIVELAVGGKRTLLRPKSATCKSTTPMRKSSKTTVAVSTSSEKVLEPYWNASCEVINSALLLPIGIDSPDSGAKSYSSLSNKTVEKSWFSTKLYTAPKRNLLPISSQFCMSFRVECMDSVDTVTKSKKIEIFPTAAQKTILRRWFGTSRYVYNQAVSLLEATDTPTNFKQLVPVIFDELPDWHVETPRQIKVGAVMDACQAVRNAKVKCKQTGEFQRVKYRSKKNLRQMLYLRADSLKENGFYVRFLGEMKMAELLPAKPQSTGKVSERDTDAEVKDSQLVMENGRYFLCVPYVEKKKPRKPSGRIVALDPGVRDFMTFFSEDSFGWLGRQCINRIQRLCQHSDNLLSRATREQRPLRRALRKAAKRIKVKIRNLIDELHKKVAHFLVTNFDIILLPTFESQQLVLLSIIQMFRQFLFVLKGQNALCRVVRNLSVPPNYLCLLVLLLISLHLKE